MRKIFALMLVLGAVRSFAAEPIPVDPKNNIEAKGVLTATVAWVKDKGEKWDLDLKIKSESDEQGMIVFLSDISCKRGKVAGVLKHTFFNTGERTMDFKPGQMKDFHLVCRLGEKSTGSFSLTIAKVYSNPSLDGKTVGKIIAKDLKWKLAEKGAPAAAAESTDLN